MDTAKIKRMIGQCDDFKELSQIREAVEARRKVLYERLHDNNVRDAWERIKGLAPGTEVWCTTRGHFIGGPFQRGDKFTVRRINQRGKRRAYLTSVRDGKGYSFSPDALERYEIKPEAPADPMQVEERKMLDDMASRVASTLTELAAPPEDE